MSAPISIDIWSDIACPWCYVGKRRLEQGLAAYRDADPDAPAVEITYHSFELAPDTPVDFDGSEVEFLAGHKGMPLSQAEQMLAQMTELAAGDGLDYHFDTLRHTNTVKAHELLHFAKAHGRQLELKERLLKAYFTEGRHLGRIDELVALAVEVGLDGESARAALESEQYLPAVHADQQQAQAYGIRGVPFFVIDGRYGISGAQSPDTFTQALTTVAGERP